MKLLKKLEDVFAAAAFAEAGEFETAKEMVKDEIGTQEKSQRTDFSGGSGTGNITEQPSEA
jgi:hypothetical protein